MAKLLRTLSITIFVSVFISGCLVIKPFYGQTYPTTRSDVEFHLFSRFPSVYPPVYDCFPGRSGGESSIFIPINTNNTAPYLVQETSADASGNRVYSHYVRAQIPENCWGEEGGRYYTRLYVHDDDSRNVYNNPTYRYRVLDQGGESCILQATFTSGWAVESWFNWLSAGCTRTQQGNSNVPDYEILLVAESF